MSKIAVALLIGIGVTVLGLFLWFGVINASCTLGINGTAANITFQGPNASSVCSGTVQRNPSHYYQYQGDPTGTELCVGDYQLNSGGSVHYIVRDTGLLNLVGSAVCKSLQNSGTGG